MFNRPFWIKRIYQQWEKVPIVWLYGPRRIGKTTLTKMLPSEKTLYVNCDLPSAKDMLKDPELFFRECQKEIIVFDEIHNLENPAQILKIGADMFGNLKILATGSSTLAATKKFKDTLTGRKRNVNLLPVLYSELKIFGANIEKRLFHGGLPQALISETKDTSFYREWAESFFSRDIQKLFGFRNWEKFNLFFEYIMRQSSGIFETTKVSSSIGISRQTVESYLSAMEITGTVSLIRPFFGGGRKELLKTPKIYGFDTGFVSFFKGWDTLRTEDKGILWEHLVLETLQAYYPDKKIMYWRDKSGREIDFVIQKERDSVDVFECKWNVDDFSPKSLKVFRKFYPNGKNYLVSPVAISYKKRYDDVIVEIISPENIFQE
jgi:predicted AAA+ superfamily ATPase